MNRAISYLVEFDMSGGRVDISLTWPRYIENIPRTQAFYYLMALRLMGEYLLRLSKSLRFELADQDTIGATLVSSKNAAEKYYLITNVPIVVSVRKKQ